MIASSIVDDAWMRSASSASVIAGVGPAGSSGSMSSTTWTSGSFWTDSSRPK